MEVRTEDVFHGIPPSPVSSGRRVTLNSRCCPSGTVEGAEKTHSIFWPRGLEVRFQFLLLILLVSIFETRGHSSLRNYTGNKPVDGSIFSSSFYLGPPTNVTVLVLYPPNFTPTETVYVGTPPRETGLLDVWTRWSLGRAPRNDNSHFYLSVVTTPFVLASNSFLLLSV